MSQILNELNEDDAFNIVTFDSYSHPWSDTMRLAQRNNVDQAVSYVHNLIAEGGKPHSGLLCIVYTTPNPTSSVVFFFISLSVVFGGVCPVHSFDWSPHDCRVIHVLES